jgi:hypothetical protein
MMNMAASVDQKMKEKKTHPICVMKPSACLRRVRSKSQTLLAMPSRKTGTAMMGFMANVSR